jgi:hypothetical protein
MRNIRELIDNLRKDFYVPNRLPDSYIKIPPKKEKRNLPSDFRDLPHALAILFPIPNEIVKIKEVADILRHNEYYVPRIPIDWIRKKMPLPPPHWFAENNDITLPITAQEQLQDLISTLQKKFIFKLPLDSRWVDISLNQQFKPQLPENFEEVASKLNLPNNQINRDSSNFKQVVQRIKDTYETDDIPEEWIHTPTPDLPILSEAKEYLLSKKIELTLPLIENEQLGSNIKQLRAHFYFESLPDDYIELSALPEPGSALLPNIC